MGTQRIVPRNEREKNKIVVAWYYTQVNKKVHCVLSKELLIQLKKNGQKCAKQFKSIKFSWYWGSRSDPSWKRPNISSWCNTASNCKWLQVTHKTSKCITHNKLCNLYDVYNLYDLCNYDLCDLCKSWLYKLCGLQKYTFRKILRDLFNQDYLFYQVWCCLCYYQVILSYFK